MQGHWKVGLWSCRKGGVSGAWANFMPLVPGFCLRHPLNNTLSEEKQEGTQQDILRDF